MAENSLQSTAAAKVDRLFHELRDYLLSISQEFAKRDTGDWEKAERFFLLSKRIDQLRREASNGPADVSAPGVETNYGERLSGTAALATRRKSKKDYPKYAVHSGVLSKTGLSRDRRTEYHHAVPRSEFELILARLAELTTRKHFVADAVLEKLKCPSYQVYLVLSLLKERGVLAVPRRGFYAFRRPKDFMAESESIWNSLGQSDGATVA